LFKEKDGKSGGVLFTVDKYYHPLKQIARGQYGSVVACRDKRTNTEVVIKRMNDEFLKNPLYLRQFYREMMTTKQIKSPHLLPLLDIIEPLLLSGELSSIQLVFPRMSRTLSDVISEGTSEQKQRWMYELLLGVSHLHEHHIIHRDLKPQNILLDQKGTIVIGDFGSCGPTLNARGADAPNDSLSMLTNEVTSLWYRAPEVICSAGHYDTKIDLWSVGCIFAELLNEGNHFVNELQSSAFFPGSNPTEMLSEMITVLGTPPGHIFHSICSDETWKRISPPPNYPQPTAEDWKKWFPSDTSSEALDLLQHLLVIDPTKRLSAKEALSHSYFTSLRSVHEPTTTATNGPSVSATVVTDENKWPSKESNDIVVFQWHDRIWKEILAFRPQSVEKYKRFQKTCPPSFLS
jgi:serine/threonine protein kinase